MQTLSFTVSALGGFGSVSGLLSLDPGELVLEFQMKDSVLGVIKTAPTEVRVPLEQLVRATLKEGWFSTTLELQARSLRAWGKFPENDMGRIRLSLEKSDREAARELVALLNPYKTPIDTEFA